LPPLMNVMNRYYPFPPVISKYLFLQRSFLCAGTGSIRSSLPSYTALSIPELSVIEFNTTCVLLKSQDSFHTPYSSLHRNDSV